MNTYHVAINASVRTARGFGQGNHDRSVEENLVIQYQHSLAS